MTHVIHVPARAPSRLESALSALVRRYGRWRVARTLLFTGPKRRSKPDARDLSSHLRTDLGLASRPDPAPRLRDLHL